MNHGAISVIYLALSAVCLIGLYGIYKPNINTAADNVFGKVERFTDQGFPQNKQKQPFDWNGITCKPLPHDGVEIVGGTPKTKDGDGSWLDDNGNLPLQIRKATYIHFDNHSMSRVTDMGGMFLSCRKLQSVTGSHPGTGNVSSMYNMFSGDTSLSNVDALGNWDVDMVGNMHNMFSGDSNINKNSLNGTKFSEASDFEDAFD